VIPAEPRRQRAQLTSFAEADSPPANEAADALCPGVGAEAPDEQRMHEDACAALRAHLGDDRFEAAREAGGRLSVEDAAAEAAEA